MTNLEFLQENKIEVVDERRNGYYQGRESKNIIWSMGKYDSAPSIFRITERDKFSSVEELKVLGGNICSVDEHVFVPSKSYSVPSGTENAYRFVYKNTWKLVQDLSVIKIDGKVYKMSSHLEIDDTTEYVYDRNKEILSLADYLAREERYRKEDENKSQASSAEGLFPAWEADGFED